MKRFDCLRNLFVGLGLIGVTAPLMATLAVTENDPRLIMKAVEAREKGDDMHAQMTMQIIDAQNRQRQRRVAVWSKTDKHGTKTLMFFTRPPDMKNTGLLTFDYDQAGKSDDQWLYLPSLRKTTRISGSDKSGSFMGSDLTYSDMSRHDLAHYDYKLLDANVEVDGQACWLIESRPRTAQEKTETGYLKQKIWVSKQRLFPLRTKSWVREGKKLKYTQFSDLKKVSGVWIAHKIVVKTMQRRQMLSSTVITYDRYRLNDANVVDALFSHRRLEQGL